MTTPAGIALDQLDRRRAYWSRQSAAEAEQKLRPWAAIALRCGADPARVSPDAPAALEDYRRANLTDAQARACVADDWCALPAALAALALSRDAAIEAVPDPADPAFAKASTEAHRLQVLAAYLGAPPYQPSRREREQEAA